MNTENLRRRMGEKDEEKVPVEENKPKHDGAARGTTVSVLRWHQSGKDILFDNLDNRVGVLNKEISAKG